MASLSATLTLAFAVHNAPHWGEGVLEVTTTGRPDPYEQVCIRRTDAFYAPAICTSAAEANVYGFRAPSGRYAVTFTDRLGRWQANTRYVDVYPGATSVLREVPVPALFFHRRGR